MHVPQPPRITSLDKKYNILETKFYLNKDRILNTHLFVLFLIITKLF